MTLIATAAASFGAADFRLEILRPNGQPYFPPRIFDSRTEGREGVIGTIDCAVTPGGISKSVKFSGLKDRISAKGGEVVVVTMNDGDGTYHAAGCGVVTVGHSPDDVLVGGNYGDLVRSYDANAEELLERSVITDNRYYPPQDIGAIVRQLIATFRHPAILYDGTLMPNMGVRLDAGFRLPAANLLTAIGELAKIVQEQNGIEVAWGVRADRKFYFNFPEGVEPITFDAEAQNYRELAIDATDLCTAVVWHLGNTPSFKNYVGAYKPSDLIHISVTDVALHEEFRAYKGLQATGEAFISRPQTIYSSNNFTNPDKAVNYYSETGEPDLTATSYFGSLGANANGYLQIEPLHVTGDDRYRKPETSFGLPVYGFQLRYKSPVPMTSNTYPSPTLTATLYLHWQALSEDGLSTFILQVSIPILYTANEYTNIEGIFPPPEKVFLEDTGKTYNVKPTLYFATLVTIQGSNPNGGFWVSDFRFMCLNTPLLDAQAKREQKVPATNPAQLRRVTYREGFPYDRFVQPTPIVSHDGRADGTKRLPVSEVRYAFSREKRFRCVVDTGNPAREGDSDRLIERISRGVDKRNERLALIRPSALL